MLHKYNEHKSNFHFSPSARFIFVAHIIRGHDTSLLFGVFMIVLFYGEILLVACSFLSVPDTISTVFESFLVEVAAVRGLPKSPTSYPGPSIWIERSNETT